MPLVVVDYDPAKGPLIDLEASFPLVEWRSAGPCPTCMVAFRVDTGSDRAHVGAQVAAQLGLLPLGQRKVTYANGTSGMVESFALDLLFPTISQRITSIQARACNPFNPNFDGILGRDVLDLSILTINPRSRKMHIEF